MKNSKKFSEICIKCQACCKVVGIVCAHEYNDKTKAFYEARGAEVKLKNGHMYLKFNFPCPQLDSKKGCLIYNDRPEICKNYPEDDSQLLETCELNKLGLL